MEYRRSCVAGAPFSMEEMNMNVQILQLIEGAKQARGLTVIIDVFRAFSVEGYAFSRGAKTILPVGTIEEAFELKKKYPNGILVGEREGIKCEGFDCGNSPSQLEHFDVENRTIIHTTSAGTQGVANAVHADEMLVAALTNARATAEYIRMRNPETVSIVCMGLSGREETEEDTLCAEYIAALLRGENPDISAEIADLANTSGKKFFDPANAEVFPQKDFEMSTKPDIFPFALKVVRGGEVRVEKVDM